MKYLELQGYGRVFFQVFNRTTCSSCGKDVLGIEEAHHSYGGYGLLFNGIFGVNIPLLYGEGPKTFMRLQEEIIRVSNTYTIFVWNTTDVSRSGFVTIMLRPISTAVYILQH